MLKACIFDLDGVIVDTAKYHYVAWKRLANELGFDITEAENEALKGVSRMDTLDIILSKGGLHVSTAEKIALADRKNTWYLDLVNCMTADEILPGALEFVTDLRRRGIGIALGSASKNAMTILEHIGMAQAFDEVIDGTKTEKSKPDPEVFLKGAAALGVSPRHCVVFEDGLSGIQAALAGGFFTIGIGEAAVLHTAHHVVAGLAQLNYPRLLEIYEKANILV